MHTWLTLSTTTKQPTHARGDQNYDEQACWYAKSTQ